MNSLTNSYLELRQRRLMSATKPFLARGITLKRCERCQLGLRHCICLWLKPYASESPVDLILLMHRDEILKPTNTGRLIAEAFPQDCVAFEWSRLEPSNHLIAMLQDPSRLCAAVYPEQTCRLILDLAMACEAIQQNEAISQKKKRLTLIFLDGTWRQAARMMNHSAWLRDVPTFPLSSAAVARYAVRKAAHENRLSTAEAAVIALQQLGTLAESEHIQHLFQVFNHHYRATRDCVDVAISDSHRFLEAVC